MTTAVNGEFIISDEIQSQYPKLVELVKATQSMDNEEKQYWFSLLTAMTEEQRTRLFDILENERKKLEQLDIAYKEEKEKIRKAREFWDLPTGVLDTFFSEIDKVMDKDLEDDIKKLKYVI